ncbi:MAG: MFS transporter [Steroidobacteraceae bacterium]
MSAGGPAPATRNDGELSQFVKISWGVGGLGATSMLYLINMFVVFFLVRHVGVSAAIAGILFAATRVYDAVIDPSIGSLGDRTRSRWGRRRPWMLVGSVLAPLACIAVFMPPALEPGPALYGVVVVTLLAYCTAYSLFSIPYMAQGTELTDHYGERASLMAWRTFFIYASGIVITAGAPALIARLGGDRAAYGTMSIAAAVVVGASMLWVVAFAGPERASHRAPPRALPALATLRTVVSNRPFVIILLTKMTLQLGTAFTGAAMLFFMTYVIKRAEGGLSELSLVSNVVGVAVVPIWNKVLRVVERRPLCIALFIAQGLTYGSWLLATPDESRILFDLRAALIGGLGSGGVLLAMTMLADTIEYDRLRTGERREGLFVGAFELMQKTSFIVGPLITGLAFSAAGLVAGQAGSANQLPAALDMMRIAVAVIPVCCAIGGVALMLSYRLDSATPTGCARARSRCSLMYHELERARCLPLASAAA